MSDISRCAMLTEALRSLINGRRSPGSRGKDEWFYTLIDATMGIIEVYRANPATLPPHMILPHLRFAKQTFPRLDHITLPLLSALEGHRPVETGLHAVGASRRGGEPRCR